MSNVAAEIDMTLFGGLLAFPITPTDEEGKVDVETYGRLLERLARAEVGAIGLLGSTGGYAYLSRGERRRAVEAAAGCIAGRVPLVVGIGALRTDDAMALARDAQAAGADGLLLAPMSYTPLTDEEVFRHYAAVAGATDLPLCIYSNPTTTHFTIGLPLLARLAHLPNVRAVKMPLPQDMTFKPEIDLIRRETPAGFSVGYSGDSGAAEALLAGADAWHSVVGGLLPEQAYRLTRAAKAGDVDEARTIDEAFRPLWALMKEFGSIRVMHAGAGVLSLSAAKPPLPLLPVPTAHLARLEAVISAVISALAELPPSPAA